MAYIAAVMAHPAFTARFQKDLVRPGLRVPHHRQTPICSRGRRARPRGHLAAHLRRALRRSQGRPPRRSAAHARRRGRRSRRPAPFPARPSPARRDELRRGREAPPHRQGLRRQRAAGVCRLRGLRHERARSGSATASATAAARSSATAARPRRSPTSSPTTGSPNTPATCSTC